MVSGQHDARPVPPLPGRPSHHVATVVEVVVVLEQRGALNETLSSILIVPLYAIRCHTDSDRHRAKEDTTSKPRALIYDVLRNILCGM